MAVANSALSHWPANKNTALALSQPQHQWRKQVSKSDTSDEYIAKVLNAAPFADNDVGIQQMCELIRALADERNQLLSELCWLAEDAAGEAI